MEKLTIKLSTTSLRKLTLKKMILAESFEWTGWRIPIYLDSIEKDDVGEHNYTFSAGSWLSNNSWQPDALEIYKVERWTFDEDGLEEGFDKDEEVDYQADYLLDEQWHELIKDVEESINNFFYSYEQKEVEIIWE
jgi:hypothetical protein